MRPSVPDVHITDSQDAEMAAYRALTGQAVLGLICGLLAPLAMLDAMFWAIPTLGVFLSVWGLRRIRDNAPAMVGRKMAIAGLTLSLIFLAAASTDWLVYRTMVRREAQQFSDLWFQYLVQGEPHKAHQLTVSPQFRRPLDDQLWAYYGNNSRLRMELEGYVKKPLVRDLLALGPKAQARLYQVAEQKRVGQSDRVDQWYAVTYEESGERKSFFVLIGAVRQKLKGEGSGWHIVQAEGGVRPPGW